MDNKPKLNDITLLRSFAVVSLVVWHSYCSYICWDFTNTPLDKFYTIFFKTVFPDANMPLFTSISGYLFCYLLVFKNKYQNFKEFLVNKTHRLFIPYLILGFTINMTQIGRQTPIDLIMGVPNHLWYCLMLFYCFIVCWFIEKKIGSKANIFLMLLSFLLVLAVAEKNIVRTPLGIYMPIYYYGYFYFGFVTFKHKDYLVQNRYKVLLFLFAVFASTSILFFSTESFGKHLLLFKCTSFILISITVANTHFIQDKLFSKHKVSHFIEIIGKYSFGIYVFHQWIIWNITRTSATHPLMNNHYIIFPLALSASVFCISALLTHLCIKTKLGRYLLT